MIEQLLYTLVLIIPLSATILFLFILLLCKILKSYSSQFIFFLLKVGIFISIMPNLVIAKAIFEISSISLLDIPLKICYNERGIPYIIYNKDRSN